MIFLKLFFAFLAIWQGIVVLCNIYRGRTAHMLDIIVFSACVCGLLWTFGIFD